MGRQLVRRDAINYSRRTTSKTSWEDAVKNAVQTAGKSLRALRVGEVTRFDVTIDEGKVTAYRARVQVSFKDEK